MLEGKELLTGAKGAVTALFLELGQGRIQKKPTSGRTLLGKQKQQTQLNPFPGETSGEQAATCLLHGPVWPALCGQPDLLQRFFITCPEIPVVGAEAPGFLQFHTTRRLESQLFFIQPPDVLLSSAPIKVSGTTAAHDGRIFWGP